MSELESAFEDTLHKLARKFNQRGLSVKAIGDAFADRAKFARCIEDAKEYPQVFSSETAARRRGEHAK
jgi:hypothetical protein